MPLIQVTMVAGRTREQKHALIANLTATLADTLGVDASRVRVAIYEISADEWGIGGLPFSDVRGSPAPAAESTPQEQSDV